MANIAAILAALLGGKQGIRPYLTPGYNGQPNPMSGQTQSGSPYAGQNAQADIAALIQQQQAQQQAQQKAAQDKAMMERIIASLPGGSNGQANPAQAPSAAAPQPLPTPQQTGAGGIRGTLGKILGNQGLMQGITQLALSQGKMGGYRGQGFAQQNQQNTQNQLQQAQLAEQQRQFDANYGINKEEAESNRKWREFQLEQLKMQREDQALQAQTQAAEKERTRIQSESKDRAERFNKADDNLRQEIQLVDPENPEAAKTAEELANWQADILQLDDSQRKRLVTRAQSLVRTMKSKPQAKSGEDTTDIKEYQYAQKNGYKGTFEQWKKQNKASGSSTANTSGDESLVDTIISNPSIYQTLTPKTKERLSPKLAERGFTQFGKSMSESAVKEITQSEEAISQLKDLRAVVEANKKYMGPVAGLQNLNPWSDARKVQAEIDLVRQKVGKALEGGVLRKEDEEKYKKILSTVMDTPDLAMYKIDNLIRDIERDISNYKKIQEQSGRYIPGNKQADPLGILK